MRNGLFLIVFILLPFMAFSQSQTDSFEVGDIFIIQKDLNTAFEYIHFQKPNFLRKRGIIPNYKSLHNKQVKIEEVYNNGTVKLVLTSEKKFFDTFAYVKASLEKAIQANELKQVR